MPDTKLHFFWDLPRSCFDFAFTTLSPNGGYGTTPWPGRTEPFGKLRTGYAAGVPDKK